MQQRQLKILKDMSGADFKFVAAKENKFGIKYYEHRCKNEEEFMNIAGCFNDYNFDHAKNEQIFYNILEYPDNTFSVIVLENEMDVKRYENIKFKRITDVSELKPIGKIHGNDVSLEPILISKKQCATIVNLADRAIAVVNINGRRLPFYVSSGASGKEAEYGIPSGKWYPLQGISNNGWLNKMPDMLQNPYLELDQICDMLEQNFPAQKMRKNAASGVLPTADYTDLLKVANCEFPEGMPPSEYTNITFLKNHCVYLPQIIDAWRSKPTDFLNVKGGILAPIGSDLLKKVQEMPLFCRSWLDGDNIWFAPIEDSEYIAYDGFGTVEGILDNLGQKMGRVLNVTVRDPKINGVGVPLYILKRYFEGQKHQEYVRATEKLENHQPQKAPEQKTTANSVGSIFDGILNRITDIRKE